MRVTQLTLPKWTTKRCRAVLYMLTISGLLTIVLLAYTGHLDVLVNTIYDTVQRKENSQSPTSFHASRTPTQNNSQSPTRSELGQAPLRLKQISIADVYKRFRHKTSSSCNNTCTLPLAICAAKTFSVWHNLSKAQVLIKTVPLFSDEEYIFPWEKEYLSHPPLTDIWTLPDKKRSKVYFLANAKRSRWVPMLSSSDAGGGGDGGGGGGKVLKGTVGEKMVFRLDLVDGYGKSRKFGGDEIRAWVTGEEEQKATGTVTDLGNGSYWVTVTPLWDGVTHMYVALVYPREYIRCALHQSRRGNHRFVVASFRKGNVKEYVLCHPTPNIPGRPCVCNMTDRNVLPYFCGRPLDPRLTCQDWGEEIWMSVITSRDLTPAEAMMAEGKSRSMYKALIGPQVTINVKAHESPKPVSPCPAGNHTQTWDSHAPKGFWSRGMVWKSVICQERNVTSAVTQRCLANHTVLIVGDSNGIKLKNQFVHLTSAIREPISKLVTHRSEFKSSESSIRILFRVHELPIFLKNDSVKTFDHGSVAAEIDRLPSEGRVAVILHYFTHFSSVHLNVLYLRLAALRDSLTSLVQRNPRAFIAVRGPHVSTVEWQTNHMFGPDILGKFIARLYREVFHDLRRHIVYLDGWEMTTSVDSRAVHPVDDVPKAMVKMIVARNCPRKRRVEGGERDLEERQWKRERKRGGWREGREIGRETVEARKKESRVEGGEKDWKI